MKMKLFSIQARAALIALSVLAVGAQALKAMPIPRIDLYTNQVSTLRYSGIEFLQHKTINPDRGIPIPGVILPGDVFSGVLVIESIEDQNGNDDDDLSGQFQRKELAIHFQYTVVSGSNVSTDPDRHFEFDILEGDFMRIYQGRDKNNQDDSVRDLLHSPVFDPLAPEFDPSMENRDELVSRATDGDLWLEFSTEGFESVNDPTANVPGEPVFIPGTTGTINRGWNNVETNETRYELKSQTLRTILGRNADHLLDEELNDFYIPHGDHSTQMIFNNFASDLITFLPPDQLFLNIFGDISLWAEEESQGQRGAQLSFAVSNSSVANPEPVTFTLCLMGLGMLCHATRRRVA